MGKRSVTVVSRPLALRAFWLLAAVLVATPEGHAQDRPGPSRAPQAVRGHLLDLEANRPVSTALVSLLMGEERLGTTSTDENGFFFLPIPDPGEYQLEASRMGYGTTVSQPFQVTLGDTLTVRFEISPRAVPLEPLLVVGRTSRGTNKFLAHREEWGRGIFLTPEMVDSIAPRHYGDVFRKQEGIWLSWGWGTWSTGMSGPVPKVRTYQGHGCLTYMVDRTPIVPGNRYILEGLDPKDIVAVEIYRSPTEVPPDLRNFQDMEVSSTRVSGLATYSSLLFYECGVAVYWTVRGW